MIVKIKPTKIQIYINKRGKTLAQIKAETGADCIINGGIFEGLSAPCPLLKVGGVWQTAQPWTDWGMSWDDAADCAMSSRADKANFISCVSLINPWDGASSALSYPAELGGSRARTAWGITTNGEHLLYCSKNGDTPESLRSKLAAQYELASLLMLDGGGSTQGDFAGERVTSTRIVQNYICFWTEQTAKDGDGMATLRKGDKGEAVRALQTALNAFGVGLDADGDFGGATYAALRRFQAAYGIDADGIAGPMTWEALDYCKGLLDKRDTLADKIISKAISELGAMEPQGDDKYITAYNAASGAGFGLDIPWCQIFVWYVLNYFCADVPLTAHCPTAEDYWRKAGKWREPGGYIPQRGDIVYFDWDKSGDSDHVGLVIDYDGDTIRTIEGNAGTALGDGVALKWRSLRDGTIRGYAADTETAREWYSVRMPKVAAEALARDYGGEVIRL